jgi:importin subunit beta-1
MNMSFCFARRVAIFESHTYTPTLHLCLLFFFFLQNYMQAFSPILLQGLSAHSATSLCQTAVGVLVDICGAIGPALQPFADGIMSALFACIRNENVHRDVKPIVISCFGDVAMAIAAAYDPYLPISAMLLMQASSQQPPADNEDMVYFINRLRTSVLEAYSGIIVGFADGQALERLESLLPQILQFLSSLSLDATKDEVVLQKAVALIGDFANEMGTFQAVKEQLNQPFISQLIREGLASPDDQVRETAAWTGQVV